MSKVNVSRWRPHVEAAEAQGVTLAAYARAHGISKYTLYAARQLMSAQSDAVKVQGSAASEASGFVAVRLDNASGHRLSARLGNGVEVSLPVKSPEEARSWLLLLSGLPCGA